MNTTKAAKNTKNKKVFVTFVSFVVEHSSWFTSRACFDARVVVLQRPDGEGLRSQRLDGRHSRRRAGQRRDARHLRHRRRPAHGAVVEERLPAEWRVDHEADLPRDDSIP